MCRPNGLRNGLDSHERYDIRLAGSRDPEEAHCKTQEEEAEAQDVEDFMSLMYVVKLYRCFQDDTLSVELLKI